MNEPAISICIPAYKNIVYFDRLLNSIEFQSFRDFEVVITDDSPSNELEDYITKKGYSFIIRYFKNDPSLGTPENWNEAIRRSNGKWIKIMHDDDWFSSRDSLLFFYESSLKFPKSYFHFSAFTNIVENSDFYEIIRCDIWDRILFKISNLNLFKRVYVGNPSCTMFLRSADIYFDNRFKFVVDFEFYIRFLNKYNIYSYIDSSLINVGFNDQQVTKYTFNVKSVQIPENLTLLTKFGINILRNILVYDYFWRLFRNLEIRDVSEISNMYKEEIPVEILDMIKFQKKLSIKMLKFGFVSKLFMLVAYSRNIFTN